MVARDVDQAARELAAWRREARQQFGLAAVAFALALGASQLRPAFAVPLLFGGVAALALGVRALAKRWELLDRLLLDRDAYAIGDVRARGAQATSMKSRHALASSIHCLLAQPDLTPSGRVGAAAQELEELADELDDEDLALDPTSAAECMRLLNDVSESPLRNPAFPLEDLRARVSRILAGFRPRRT